MRKDSRLSFRLSPKLSSRIDVALLKSKGEIRDRSEFGTKAVQYYLDFLQNSESREDLLIKAILSIANKTNISGDEIENVRDLLYNDEITPIENHPRFEDLMILREKFSREIKNEISNRLFESEYDDIDDVYEYYEKQFYLIGTGRPNIETLNKEKL